MWSKNRLGALSDTSLRAMLVALEAPPMSWMCRDLRAAIAGEIIRREIFAEVHAEDSGAYPVSPVQGIQ